jgi:hypothetical protein
MMPIIEDRRLCRQRVINYKVLGAPYARVAAAPQEPGRPEGVQMLPRVAGTSRIHVPGASWMSRTAGNVHGESSRIGCGSSLR